MKIINPLNSTHKKGNPLLITLKKTYVSSTNFNTIKIYVISNTIFFRRNSDIKYYFLKDFYNRKDVKNCIFLKKNYSRNFKYLLLVDNIKTVLESSVLL